MTNPNTRKAGKASNNKTTSHTNNNAINDDNDAAVLTDNEEKSATADEEDESDTTPTNSDTIVDEEEDDVNSCSSFSLQECINEFRARRIRRISTHSRGEAQAVVVEERKVGITACIAKESEWLDPTDVDLINQNRSNKEQERKCKPCKNGFCYCFTSDSGDGGGVCNAAAAARGLHVRHARRNKKSEPIQNQNILLEPSVTKQPSTKSRESKRQNEPGKFHPSQQHNEHQSRRHDRTGTCVTSGQNELRAVSRLETSTSIDAPLVHIIQELRDNCVISEVRVNKHKIQAQQRSRSLNARQIISSPSKKTQRVGSAGDMSSTMEHHNAPMKNNFGSQYKQSSPSAPALDKITEKDSDSEKCFIYSTPLDSSSKSNDTTQRKHKAGGLLLQKRLSGTNIQCKPRNLNEPPPKPPRRSMFSEDKRSVSSLASTTPSVREAERILDQFLKQRGYQSYRLESAQLLCKRDNKKMPNKEQIEKSTYKEDVRPETRMSYPLTPQEEKHSRTRPLPSCPSLSDIEGTVSAKKKGYYEKNICQPGDKTVKEIAFGWKEPKICEMLNYDGNANQREFKSQAAQAEPQSIGWQEPQNIGWQAPHKIDIDTVDGNLASNIEIKDTPVKARVLSARKSKKLHDSTQKFIWSEQLRNLSPWSKHKCAGNRDGNLKNKLKSSSRTFLNTSKKKILRLVSPKKDNKEQRQFIVRKTPLRTIGIQTSREDLRSYKNSDSLTPQSPPPGSYHSAVQTSQQNSSTTHTRSQLDETDQQFDFSRTVQSPPKKAPRLNSHRKLNFPLNCGGNLCVDRLSECDVIDASPASTADKTYRSFHSDLDQDVTLSKMGYILSNIRAKLEASDNHAVRTFQEIERREKRSAGFDCPDSQRIRAETRVDIHCQVGRCLEHEYGEPIYSEIEDKSIHISGSPHFDNKTGIEHSALEQYPEVLYAKVNKPPKIRTASSVAPTALGKFLHESLQNISHKSGFEMHALPPEPSSCDVSYSKPPSEDAQSGSSVCRLSLNNIRVREHNSPPKKNRNLSKSDLSLHRSEIFLENLCCSEIITEGIVTTKPQQKINNCKSTQCDNLPSDEYDTTESDHISYEMPQDVDTECYIGGSHMGVNAIGSPHTHNQSTPKKANKEQPPDSQHTYMTKHFLDEETHNAISSSPAPALHSQQRCHNSNSCPSTPSKLPHIPLAQQQKTHTASLNEIYLYQKKNNHNEEGNHGRTQHNIRKFASSSSTHYKRLKNVLKKSFRRSKKFMKSESKRFSLNFPTPPSSSSEPTSRQNCEIQINSNSSFDLDKLFALEENVPVAEQVAKAVSICRQLPNLEISSEMVEAERLLLVCTLQPNTKSDKLFLVESPRKRQRTKRFFIDGMRLPVKANVNQDLFFNYFYICTFQYGSSMKSTQSVECRNNEAIFRECGIEFDSYDDQDDDLQLRGHIFMLRLRKVSTLALEPQKTTIVKLPANLTPSPASSSSSGETIASRFRLQATFVLNYGDFVPYEYVDHESKKSNSVCLRAAKNCVTSLTSYTKSSNLTGQILLNGRAEIRFPKHTYSGFLNVQDPHNQHNWNRRWCILEGLQLSICQDDMTEFSLLKLDMQTSMQPIPIIAASRELCARPRSFCLQCFVGKADEQLATAAVFFAAETQTDLVSWLEHINAALNFVVTWMR